MNSRTPDLTKRLFGQGANTLAAAVTLPVSTCSCYALVIFELKPNAAAPEGASAEIQRTV
jgi:hypothetical protein